MKKSAGILLFKKVKGNLVVFLVHPGGPFWKNKDEGAWSIPKGEFANEEDPLLAAQREFEEETGQRITGDFVELKPVKLKSGKMVYAWAVKGDVDADHIVSNTFKVEWPYKSGRWQTYPEVDKAAWLTLDEARKKINMAQTALLDELENLNG